MIFFRGPEKIGEIKKGLWREGRPSHSPNRLPPKCSPNSVFVIIADSLGANNGPFHDVDRNGQLQVGEHRNEQLIRYPVIFQALIHEHDRSVYLGIRKTSSLDRSAFYLSVLTRQSGRRDISKDFGDPAFLSILCGPLIPLSMQ